MTVPSRSTAADAPLLGLAVSANARGRRAAAHTQLAHRLRSDGRRVLGFLPADPELELPPVLTKLGGALCELEAGPIAIVEAVTGRALPELAGPAYALQWLHGTVALITPGRTVHAGEIAPRLARVIGETRDLFGHMLVDLGGLEQLGEHASAVACVDAIAVVGRAHHTHQRALLRLADLVPTERFLGIVLAD